MVYDKHAGRSKGFCYVEFKTKEGLEAALAKDGEVCESLRILKS